jgi:hypothetical protein
MSKVYGVARGAYSDYRVEFICPTKEIAEALIAKLNGGRKAYDEDEDYQWGSGSDYRLAEFSMVTDIADVVRPPSWRVWIDTDGNVVTEDYEEQDTLNQWAVLEDNDIATQINGVYSQPTAAVCGSSYRGRDVALKVARDKLAEIKAAAAGL